MNQHLDPREYQEKWIYPDEKLRYLNDDPFTLMQEPEWSRAHFFPTCSDFDTLAYDCLPKTVNQALGFLFFSQRKQVIRLIMMDHKITLDDAIKLKSRGGVAIQALTDFAIQGDRTYSFKTIAEFSRTCIDYLNCLRKYIGLTIKSPSKVKSDYIKKLILDEETYKQLVVIFHGNNEVNFAHAACSFAPTTT